MYGPIYRVDLLMKNLGYGGNLQPANLVAAMNEAATQDVREVTIEPIISRLLRTGPAPSARDATMLSLLDAWNRHGSSRLDRTDPSGIGNITDPGAAIMDAAWPLIADAWAKTVLGPKSDLAAREPGDPVPESAGWPGGRLVRVHEQGPAHDPRRAGEGQVRGSILRWRQPQAVSKAPVGRDHRGRSTSSQRSRDRTRLIGARARPPSGSRSSPVCSRSLVPRLRSRCDTRTGRAGSSRWSASAVTRPATAENQSLAGARPALSAPARPPGRVRRRRRPLRAASATTPRWAISSATAAAASTANCQPWRSAAANGIAAPRIAPIAAGPAPSRNA